MILAGAALGGAALTGATLTGAALTGATLTKATRTGAATLVLPGRPCVEVQPQCVGLMRTRPH